jgi:hypothetical protein
MSNCIDCVSLGGALEAVLNSKQETQMLGGHGSPLYVVRLSGNENTPTYRYKIYDPDGPLTNAFAEYDPLKQAIVIKAAARHQKFSHLAQISTDTFSARPYARLFGNTEYTELFPKTALEVLGQAMTWPHDSTTEIPDSSIPAGYTYLGQLLFHDITWIDPDSKVPRNKTSSILDLTSIIGKEAATEKAPAGPFAVGQTINIYPWGSLMEDLPREQSGASTGRPCIADSRNDSFLPLAQTHLLFLKFFNRIAACAGYGSAGYDRCQTVKLYIQHIQHMVLEDYLRQIIDDSVYTDVKDNGRRFISPNGTENYEVSIEFAAALGRFGHSMIRRRYPNWNSAGVTGNIGEFTRFSYRNKENGPMTGLESDWVTSWQHLFSFPELSQEDLPLRAACIGPHLASTLGSLRERLRHEGADPPNATFSLADATLQRQRSLGLAPAETAIEIMNGFLGQASVEALSPEALSADLPSEARRLFGEKGTFRYRTPLWFYMLREAQLVNCGNKLGPFASRLVMETVHACIAKSDMSVIGCRDWKPELPRQNTERFTMTDLIRFAGDVDPIS